MSEEITQCLKSMHLHRICVVMPTYNNAGSLSDVIVRVLAYTPHLIVVNDGSTDNTADILQKIKEEHPDAIEIVNHQRNRGKGAALMTAFKVAEAAGYQYVITIDSDGQHYPEDIPVLVSAHNAAPCSIIVGQRNINAMNMPGANTFANKFSNFWFWVETGIRLDDTQTGFRLYPLNAVYWKGCITSRYEAELELLVYAAWHGVKLHQTPIRVHYAPIGERVSHFRPGLDFTRISILNSVLCFFTITYAWPMRLARKLFRK